MTRGAEGLGSRMRRIAIDTVDEKAVGVLQCLASAVGAWGSRTAPFNGQQGRQRLFRDIVGRIRFDEIAETGTFRGATAAFMARVSGLPVHTAEHSPRHFAYSRTRFLLDRNVRVSHMDSRSFLVSHFASRGRRGKVTFVYLDAHWGPDLPLYEETRILFALPADLVVMIDDFRVPADAGYGYDSYGPDATLDLDYLRIGEIPGIQVFFPVMPSSEETGARRGCVVLAKAGLLADKLRSLDSLRSWPS